MRVKGKGSQFFFLCHCPRICRNRIKDILGESSKAVCAMASTNHSLLELIRAAPREHLQLKFYSLTSRKTIKHDARASKIVHSGCTQHCQRVFQELRGSDWLLDTGKSVETKICVFWSNKVIERQGRQLKDRALVTKEFEGSKIMYLIHNGRRWRFF